MATTDTRTTYTTNTPRDYRVEREVIRETESDSSAALWVVLIIAAFALIGYAIYRNSDMYNAPSVSMDQARVTESMTPSTTTTTVAPSETNTSSTPATAE